MKKSILALALGGAAVAVGAAVKNAIEKKKEHNSEEYFAVPDFLYNKTAVLDVLYKRLPEGVVIKNATNPHGKGRVLEDTELREGELSASIYQVGCYSVRIVERVYREGNFEPISDATDDEIRFEGKSVKQGEAIIAQSFDIPPLKNRYNRPATKDELEEYRNATKNPYMATINPPRDYQKVKEVSAAYMDGEYKNICQVMYSKYGRYSDRLTFMGTVKLNKSVTDSQASLFVGSNYVGDSFGIKTFYAFSPDGYVRYYQIHDMNPDSWEGKWNWNG